MSANTFGIAVLTTLLFALQLGTAAAQGDAPQKPNHTAGGDGTGLPKAATDDNQEKPAKKDPFAVPREATPEDLITFVEELVRKEVQLETRAEQLAHLRKLSAAIREASNKVLAASDVEESVALDALEWLFQALEIQEAIGESDTVKMQFELAKKYSTDSRRRLAKFASQKLLFARIKTASELKPDEQDALIDDAVAFIRGPGILTEKSKRQAIDMGMALEGAKSELLAAKLYDKLSELFSKQTDEELAEFGKRLLGFSRRARLVGKPIEIEGLMIDGKPIDWASYKGKVVLIDFWATWCGPCIAEMSNVKENYLAYHSKGFDVVGISLDDEKEPLQKFLQKNYIPWANLFSTDKDAMGMEHPLAVKYGVMLIPQTILVGQDGNVIQHNVRGEELGAALKKLLGPRDEDALNAAIEKEEKARKKDADTE